MHVPFQWNPAYAAKAPPNTKASPGSPISPRELTRAIGVMDQQPRVETVEEFKLRIAAIIRGKPEHISGAPRPNPLLVRPKKRAKSRKAQRR